VANLRREHHYLPQCYQLGFTDESGRVWVKGADKQEPQHRKPRKVGKSRSFYIRTVNGVEDDSIEKFFGEAVETGFGLVSQRIKSEQSKVILSGTEMGFLVRFVAAQLVRTMAHKECVDTQAGRTVDRDTYLRVMGRQLITITKALEEKLPSFQFFTSLPLVTQHFITGDNPVVVFTATDSEILGLEPARTITQLPAVLSNRKTQFVLTLSPYMAIAIDLRQPNSETVNVVPLDSIGVLRLNGVIRGQCRLFTLARDRESLL
jgi:hypothetical protein